MEPTSLSYPRLPAHESTSAESESESLLPLPTTTPSPVRAPRRKILRRSPTSSFSAELLSAAPTRSKSVSCKTWLPFVGALTLVGMCSSVVYIPPERQWSGHAHSAVKSNSSSDSPSLSFANLTAAYNDASYTPPSSVSTDEHALVSLFARQSRTLEQATARYELRTDQAPPEGFHRWFSFARERRCLVDEYTQVQHDFAPFYELAKTHPARFAEMVRKGVNMVQDESDPRGIAALNIKNGTVKTTLARGDTEPELKEMISSVEKVAAHLQVPNMDILLNTRAHPRVLFDVDTNEDGALLRDPDAFRRTDFESGVGTSGRCGSARQRGETATATTTTEDYTTDLWPLLSTARSPCFADILVPSEPSAFEPEQSNLTWTERNPVLYWQETRLTSSNLTSRLRVLARSRPGYMYIDAAVSLDASANVSTTSSTSVASASASRRQAPETTPMTTRHSEASTTTASTTGAHSTTTAPGRHSTQPPSSLFEPTADLDSDASASQFRFLLDVDTNAPSERFVGLLKSGGLVFKATPFTTALQTRLRAFEHYIPVLPDLSDLMTKIEWARKHDAEAQAIQQKGRRAAEEIVTEGESECYWGMVLLEWRRLLEMANANFNGTQTKTTTGSFSAGGSKSSATASLRVQTRIR